MPHKFFEDRDYLVNKLFDNLKDSYYETQFKEKHPEYMKQIEAQKKLTKQKIAKSIDDNILEKKQKRSKITPY